MRVLVQPTTSAPTIMQRNGACVTLGITHALLLSRSTFSFLFSNAPLTLTLVFVFHRTSNPIPCLCFPTHLAISAGDVRAIDAAAEAVGAGQAAVGVTRYQVV